MKEITKIYEGPNDDKYTVLDRISFTIERGEIFGLLGPNGAGKSTLIKILLGLTRATFGSMLIEGKDISQSSREIKKVIGYVPEKVNFYGNLTAVETLDFFGSLKEVPRSRSQEVLKQVGLTDYANQRVGNFSKGMLQRVGVAQSLLSKPKLLVLDEPTSGLDPVGVIEFKQLIRELNNEGITILFTSHIMSEVEELARRIALIKRGKLQAVDTLSRIKSQMGLKPRLEIKLKEVLSSTVAMALAAGAENVETLDSVLQVNCKPEMKAGILAAIEGSGAKILDLWTIEPSLEEIFVKFLNSEKESEVSV